MSSSVIEWSSGSSVLGGAGQREIDGRLGPGDQGGQKRCLRDDVVRRAAGQARGRSSRCPGGGRRGPPPPAGRRRPRRCRGSRGSARPASARPAAACRPGSGPGRPTPAGRPQAGGRGGHCRWSSPPGSRSACLRALFDPFALDWLWKWSQRTAIICANALGGLYHQLQQEARVSPFGPKGARNASQLDSRRGDHDPRSRARRPDGPGQARPARQRGSHLRGGARRGAGRCWSSPL